YHGLLLFAPLLYLALDTKNRYSASTTDQIPLQTVLWRMLGHQFLFPVPDLDRTDFFLVIGANPAVSNGSIMTSPNTAGRIQEIRARGGRVVVVDPIRTRTAALAGEHLFIRPGTDVAFLAAMLNVLFEKGLADPGRLSPFCSGMGRLAVAVQPFTPAAASRACGVAAWEIVRLAGDFASASSGVCYGRVGSCVQQHGTLTSWLILALNIVTGKMDRPGGFLFPRPAVDMAALATAGGEKGSFGRWKSRVRGLPEVSGELPVAVLAEEIENPGEERIRGLISITGNPALSAPNGPAVERALPKLEFFCAVDWYINETTRHAHVILPPASPLEHDQFELLSQFLGIRAGARYSPAVFEKPSTARYDWEILRALAGRGAKNPVTGAALSIAGPMTVLSAAVRFGPRGRGILPGGLTMEEIKQHPHGLDLGPLEGNRLPDRLYTPDKKIHLAPKPFVEELGVVAGELSRMTRFPRRYPMTLVSRRQVRTNNSWLHNSPKMMKKNACTAWLNPEDAAPLGVRDGDAIRVRSRVGEISLPVRLTEDVMPGVVCVPHGWGHTRPGIHLSVAAQNPGVSVNDITDNRFLDHITGTAAFSGVPVRVEKAE
ncbi:MAG: molybdopterin-dependent oxidoreductase, partial [Proteobacteria bacterium]|nr:molybdopterin-dependent oxidoreductase [Pseudomonadota bacterium]